MKPTNETNRDGTGGTASLRPFVVTALCAMLVVWVLRRIPLPDRSTEPTTTLETAAVSPSPDSAGSDNRRSETSPSVSPNEPGATVPVGRAKHSDATTVESRLPTPRRTPVIPSTTPKKAKESVSESAESRPTVALKKSPTSSTIPKKAVAAWRSELDKLARDYGIQVLWSGDEIVTDFNRKHRGQLTFPSEVDLERRVPLIISEITRYPVDVVKKMRLERIVLCRGLSVDLYRRAGLAVLSEHTLYLDLGAFEDDQEQLRLAIHHELFHVIDHADDGSLEDVAWKKLNRVGFNYARGASGASDDPTVLLARSVPAGFVSKYSTVGVEEDKAEVFACLMTDTEGLASRASKDRVVANKVRYLEGLLEKFAGGRKFWTSPRLSDTTVRQPPAKPQDSLPKDWPPCKRMLPRGNHFVRIRNPNSTAVKAGLRSGDAGVDVDVPASGTHTVQVPAGVYQMFFHYKDQGEEVYRGDDVTLRAGVAGVEIQLVSSVGGNYQLRRYRRP